MRFSSAPTRSTTSKDGSNPVFYGVSPAVIALILHSSYRLSKLGMEDRVQWAIAAVCFIVTIALQTEVALLFIAAGAVGVFYYGRIFRGLLSVSPVAAVPLIALAHPAASGSILFDLLTFFLKAGAFTFGSGLVIVPFLEQGLVTQYGWIGEREFLIAVAVGMISPGPVVITATFVGYLVAGFWGSVASTVGIFLPSFLIVLIAAPIVARHRQHPRRLCAAWKNRARRLADDPHRCSVARCALSLEGQQSAPDRRCGSCWSDRLSNPSARLGHDPMMVLGATPS